MPPFEFDPTKVAAVLTIFSKGEYEFLIGEPRSFQREAGEDKHLSVGIRFPVQAETDGKKGRQLYSLYLHSENASGFAKRFLMAALGYNLNDAGERKFDDDVKGSDWGYNPEVGSCGDMWREVTGHRAIGEVDIQSNEKTGEPMQKWLGWRPITSVSGTVAA